VVVGQPHPPEEVLIQLGEAMTNEMIDLIGDAALATPHLRTFRPQSSKL
jgi:hypothetical protein